MEIVLIFLIFVFPTLLTIIPLGKIFLKKQKVKDVAFFTLGILLVFPWYLFEILFFYA